MSDMYESARAKYRELGIDTEAALATLKGVHLGLHCWQADDVGGFEHEGASLDGGGIQVTGNYPGKARTLAELRADLEKALTLIPGTHRLNLHASYADFSKTGWVDRDALEPTHFDSWLDWGKKNGVMIDFNSTLFSHPKADSGFTLSSKEEGVRTFWVEHVKRCRKIAAYIGEKQGSPCIHNIWIPDGAKDIPVDRMGYRKILKSSLDEILAVKYSRDHLRDAVESKLFGIGSEAYVVGSHEFYMGYSLSNDIHAGGPMLCLDMGHFHLTESVADKISSVFTFQDELLLHVSRPIRWDSDHVVIFNDDLKALMEELVRAGALAKTHLGLDFFDATINRLGAYAIGSRSSQKAILAALLEPHDLLVKYEEAGNGFARLALLEEARTLPLGAVWEEFCKREGVPTDRKLIEEVTAYERDVSSRRN